ncbi:hypothetical protein [Geomonas anaerohicana]|uniref:Uncharacterized protein n=1 Tax=Geomonas anaerohicana TaxID=2798583 RepID=A0ABS0Y8Y8_9BACT|nr:hypothetical protein [Geomonas anaerohicana]MBJ6748762.1 hypothetical protein [Geomonas anaerohicana]
MDFDYTKYIYLPDCKDGCGAITDWLSSRKMAREAGENHHKSTGHDWVLIEKMREE